jgi:hypothetical protein
MEPLFQFFEVVLVSPRCTRLAHLAGQEGAVLGRAHTDSRGWSYAVHLYELDRTWSFRENELEPTGKMDSRESFYDGTVARVTVDPRTGGGTLKSLRREDDGLDPG